jgi:hypothetical protein
MVKPRIWVVKQTKSLVFFSEKGVEPSQSQLRKCLMDEEADLLTVVEPTDYQELMKESGWTGGELVYGTDKDLKLDDATNLVWPRDPDKAYEALEEFIKCINTAGGVSRYNECPYVDSEWTDSEWTRLGAAYMKACKVLNIRPKVKK